MPEEQVQVGFHNLVHIIDKIIDTKTLEGEIFTNFESQFATSVMKWRSPM